jgi:Fe2+ transport system protein FeoA
MPEKRISEHRHDGQLPLSRIAKGTTVTIAVLPDGIVKSQFIRLGICEGQKIRCRERLPGGTLIVERNRQEIAIGGALAKKILVVMTRI